MQTEEKPEEAVDAINKKNRIFMRNIIFLLLIISCCRFTVSAQTKQDTVKKTTYKKRVLESAEISFLTSLYTQDGSNAAVTGGIGTEELKNFANNINVMIPLNDDDVLTADITISAYSSASSGNLNPFTGASGDDDDDDEYGSNFNAAGPITGTPWVASSGASNEDVWVSPSLSYTHSSDDRNKIFNADISFANEYDYVSLGAGLGYSYLFNEKNTEIGINAKTYIDTWRPEYPTEIKTYIENNGNLNADFFNGVDILDSQGIPIDKNGTYIWQPLKSNLISDKGRNTYSVSLNFSQILGKKAQIALFSDLVLQKGWLANPMQRVYFKDIDNFYIGNALSIDKYTSPENKDVFQLADDIERLPDTRFKIPIGMQFNYFINEFVVVRTYYRYYFDDWDINSQTFNIEIPLKIGMKYTLYPAYRFYTQTAAKYFAPYEEHLSTEEFYTSDYDLSEFNASQIGFGVQYKDIFTDAKVWKVGLKTLNLNYAYYYRNSGLKAHIITLGAKFIID